MAIHPSFFEYMSDTFFANEPEEFALFQKSLLRPLRKTIRINTNQRDIPSFISEKTAEGWVFSPTPNGHVFHVDRTNRELALGSTPEHLRWDFYIQELSASMSVWHLAEGRIHEEPFHILEMASSPGGKTTQLAEHYPNSFIVANEFTKDRMNALLENIERMGVSNIAVTNMNGVQYRDVPEAFDFVLLDAPCSGEGIGFKAEESLRYWNIKNVRTIARLQSKLLLAGLAALKPGGTLLYSTCTLNTIENEGVLETAKALYGDLISISFAKRFWPHKEVAGGFYVAKIQKRGSLPTDTQKESSGEIRSIMNTDIAPLRDKELRQIQEVIEAFPLLEKNGQLYRYKNDVLYIRHTWDISSLLKQVYCIKLGTRIGRLENGAFRPTLEQKMYSKISRNEPK